MIEVLVPTHANGALTAYARRSPFGSDESCVGLPRSVFGEAASILSIAIDIVMNV